MQENSLVVVRGKAGCAPEVGTCQVCPGKASRIELGISQVSSGEVAVGQIAILQFDSPQIPSGKIPAR